MRPSQISNVTKKRKRRMIQVVLTPSGEISLNGDDPGRQRNAYDKGYGGE